jgi:hypothetical protein
MGKFDKFCQSCGMPMDKDPQQGGTYADGTKNLKFCSYCYTAGKFNDNFTGPSEMVKLVRTKLKEMGYGPLKRWFYTSHISQLDRWKPAGKL